MIGSTLLHYTVDAQLGQGGMGTVYRARDTLLNRTVALKVLTAESDDAMRRLLHEARSAAAFNHPNSVAIYSVEHHGSTSFIVMEHVAGTPLDSVIPPDGLPIDRAIQFACDISEAIDEATRAVTAGATFSHPRTVVGTIGYLAPEQITGAPSGPRSDVFALGAVIFQMIVGQPPFRRDAASARPSCGPLFSEGSDAALRFCSRGARRTAQGAASTRRFSIGWTGISGL